LEFPFNISATAEDSDFRFGTQLGGAKVYHKITPRGKSGRGHGLGKLPNILESLFNISVTADASDCKFGMQLGFAKAHHKITPKGESGRGLGLEELPNILGSPVIFSYGRS